MRNIDFTTVVMGDLHGRRDVAARALADLGFTDASGRWAGGSRTLIQLGDVIDRGPEGLALMELLIQLQAQARAAGGDVICLIGNHESIAMRAAAGDHFFRMNWTYNGGGANYVEWLDGQGLQGDDRELPYPEEFYMLFGPGHRYGRWLRTHQMACQVGEYVVVHAGWAPGGPPSVAEANDLWATTPDEAPGFLAAISRPEHPLSDPSGLLWSRDQPEADIVEVCERLGCRGLIAGHTIRHGIHTSVDGRLVQIDVGMLIYGAWAAVGLDGEGRLWALMEGREPQRIAADGFIPLPAAQQAMQNRIAAELSEPQQQPDAGDSPNRYPPGSLLRLYRSRDGDWSQYLLVQRTGSIYGGASYEGRWITRTASGWSWRPGVWPAERIERFGQLASSDEVPQEITSGE
jgi:hypothetical protein